MQHQIPEKNINKILLTIKKDTTGKRYWFLRIPISSFQELGVTKYRTKPMSSTYLEYKKRTIHLKVGLFCSLSHIKQKSRFHLFILAFLIYTYGFVWTKKKKRNQLFFHTCIHQFSLFFPQIWNLLKPVLTAQRCEDRNVWHFIKNCQTLLKKMFFQS